MKVQASVKKRCEHCYTVTRKGRVYVYFKGFLRIPLDKNLTGNGVRIPNIR